MQLKTVGESLTVFKNIDNVLVSMSNYKGLDAKAETIKKLIDATKGYSLEATKMAISQSTLDKAQIKAIISTHNLEKEVKEATIAELTKVTADNRLTASQKKTTTSTTGLSMAMKGLGSEIKGFGSSVLGLIKAHPIIAAITAITAVVGTAIISAKQYQEEQEELIENAKALQEEYRSVTKSLSDSISSLESQKAGFSKLAEGVDEFGNNISLSADEYDRYKSIVSEVIGYTPELISGYDAEGNAIANKNSLIERSIELMKEEQRQKLKEMTTDEKTSTAYDAATASWNQTKGYDVEARNNIYSLLKNKDEEYNILNSLGLYDEYKDYKSKVSSMNQNLSSFIHDNHQIVIDAIKENKQSLYDAQDNFGENIFTTEEVDNLVDWANEWQKAYTDWQKEIEDAKHGMDDQFELYAQRADGYEDLTDAQKAFVNEYIKATGDIIDADGNLLSEDEILKKAKSYEKFVDKLASDPNFEVARNNINKLFALDSEVSAGEYEKQVDAILADLQKEFDLTDEEIKDFKISLGFEFTSEGTTRTSELIQMVQDKLSDEFDGKALELSLDDLVIASNLEVSPGTLLSWEELIKLINEAKGLDANKTENLTPEELNTNINNSLDTIQKSHTALQEFKDAMENGMTESALSGVAELSSELKAMVAEFYAGTVSADELYSALKDHYTTDLENYGDAIIAKNELNEEFYTEIGLADADFVNAMNKNYGVDISNCKTYAAAKLKIEQTLSEKCGKIWTKYYNAQLGTMTSEYESLKSRYEILQDPEIGSRAPKYYIDQVYSEYKQVEDMMNQYNAAIDALNQVVYDGIGTSFDSIGSGLSSSSSSSSKIFDWIETKISRIQREITNLGKKVSATYLTWTTRNDALLSELSRVNEEILAQKDAYETYLSLANSVGLSEPYKSLVQSGGLRIDTITDENLREKIELYQEYYEKYLEAFDAYNDGATTLADLTRQQFDNVSAEFDGIIDNTTSQIDKLNAYIDQVEARGHLVSESYYREMSKIEEGNITTLQNKYNQLSSLLQQAVDTDRIKEGSEEYNNMKAEIDDVALALIEANTALIEYDNSIRDLQWERFDKLQELISEITEEADFLIELLSDEKMFDNGITEFGQATMGLHVINYETYRKQADEYANAIKELDEEFADDSLNQDYLARRDELVDLQRESILASQDELQSIIDLKREGYDELLSSLDEAIEKYNELHNAEKSQYDYQKNIAEQVKNISSLEKQLMAYEGNTSESAMATVQKLKVELEDAKASLEETEMDKNIEEREKLLTSIRDEAEQWINERLDNEDLILQEVMAETNGNIDSIRETLESETDKVGTALSTEMDKILGGDGIGSIVSVESTISDTLTDIKDLIQSMVTDGDKIADNNISDVNAPTIPDTDKPTEPPTNVNHEESDSGGNSDWGSWFIPKKDSYDKSKLKPEVSIIDRLKKLDFDSSQSARSSYYSAMGGSGKYTGSSSQNRWMIAEMKKHGMRTGGTIGSLIKSTGEDGFVLARTGEEVLSLDKIKELGFTFEKMKPIVDTMKYLPNVQSNISNRNMDIKVDIGDIQMYGVNNPEQFATQLKSAINSNSSVRKMLNDVTLGDALGHNTLTRYTR